VEIDPPFYALGGYDVQFTHSSYQFKTTIGYLGNFQFLPVLIGDYNFKLKAINAIYGGLGYWLKSSMKGFYVDLTCIAYDFTVTNHVTKIENRLPTTFGLSVNVGYQWHPFKNKLNDFYIKPWLNATYIINWSGVNSNNQIFQPRNPMLFLTVNIGYRFSLDKAESLKEK
jgi:hypothetical protein